MSLNRRLRRLEDHRDTVRDRRSPPETYAWIRSQAEESIRESLQAGEEPRYRVAKNGDVLTADGRLVENYGDFLRVLDEHIAALDREIAELEAG